LCMTVRHVLYELYTRSFGDRHPKLVLLYAAHNDYPHIFDECAPLVVTSEKLEDLAPLLPESLRLPWVRKCFLSYFPSRDLTSKFTASLSFKMVKSVDRRYYTLVINQRVVFMVLLEIVWTDYLSLSGDRRSLPQRSRENLQCKRHLAYKFLQAMQRYVCWVANLCQHRD
jgi:hypothetical protein